MTRTALLVGRHSGKGRAAAVTSQLADLLTAGGHDVQVVEGSDAADAKRLCDAAVGAGLDNLVAVGGDGTAHLALQSVAGTATALGIVPTGTGNDLAHALGLPAGADAAAARLLTGEQVVIDAVRTDTGHWWSCVLGAGFDAAVNDRANRMSWPRGRRRYDLAVVAELRTYRPVPFVLHLDGVKHEAEAMLVALGNGPSYGGGMRVCPDARLDDGLLDVVVVGPLSRTRFLRLFPSVFKGAHVSDPAVTVYRAGEVRLEGPRVSAYADGEPLGSLPITSTVVPGALRVIGGLGT